MSRIAVEGLERLLQAGLETGKGCLAAGDEEYAERFFVLGRAYDPAHRSRFAPWLEALAELRTADCQLAQFNSQAVARIIESLWETHRHREALRPTLLGRLQKARLQVPDDAKGMIDDLIARITKQELSETLEASLQRQAQEMERQLALVQRLREQAAEFEGEEPYTIKIRTTLLKLALQLCNDVLMARPDDSQVQRYRDVLQDSIQAMSRAQDSRRAFSILHVAKDLLERAEFDQAEAVLECSASLNAEIQRSMATQTEELRRQITLRREEWLQEAKRRQEELLKRTQQQVASFLQQHSRMMWHKYELPTLIEAIEEGERLVAQAGSVDVASSDLDRYISEMCQQRDKLRNKMLAAWQLAAEKHFDQAIQILADLGRDGLTIIVGPNGEQEYLEVFMAQVHDAGESHFKAQARNEIEEAQAHPDPRDGVYDLRDFLQSLPRRFALSRTLVEEALQELQLRVSRWVDAERLIQLASSRSDPAERLARLMRAKERCPQHPGLDEKIAKAKRQKEAQELAEQALARCRDGWSSLNRKAVSEAEASCNEALEMLQKAQEMDPELEPRSRRVAGQIERLHKDVEDAKRRAVHSASRVRGG